MGESTWADDNADVRGPAVDLEENEIPKRNIAVVHDRSGGTLRLGRPRQSKIETLAEYRLHERGAVHAASRCPAKVVRCSHPGIDGCQHRVAAVGGHVTGVNRLPIGFDHSIAAGLLGCGVAPSVIRCRRFRRLRRSGGPTADAPCIRRLGYGSRTRTARKHRSDRKGRYERHEMQRRRTD